MKFCSKCDNMYYLSIDSSNPNKVIYYCRCCGNTNNELDNEKGCIIDTQTDTSSEIQSHINEFTKHDPTLPHLYDVLCINKNCPTYTEKKAKDVIYIRYNEKGLKYYYLCAVCDTSWKTNDARV